MSHAATPYINIPPHLVDVVSVVERVVAQLRERTMTCTDQQTEFELEARFGRYESGRWINGVDRLFWGQILQIFTECEHWTEVVDGEWKHQHDFFYELSDGRRVRTSSSFDIDNQPLMDVQHVTKTRYSTVDLHVPTGGKSVYDIRVALSSETPVPPQDLPDTVIPTLVRIKQRRSFIYKHWRFDMTKVWSGGSRLAAEQAQQAKSTTYEIELECASPVECLQSSQDNYIATSLLLKMCDLLPEPLGKLDLFVHGYRK